MDRIKKNVKRHYSTIDKEKSRKYYLLGLSLNEVSKLMDIPERTLQKWQQKEGWVKYKETYILKAKAIDLKQSGFSNKQIAGILKISCTTVWRYCK
ncbi:hypothetical protein [Chryseobacterium sp. T20]|uniref:hypothetical protein n=1 Tax=Chryseobacterium sp. T20 TaxID=3395375 RepID=UPI0039BD2DD9